MAQLSEKKLKWFADLLRELQEQNFYGKIVIEMREGQVVLVRREETIKPPE